MEKKPKTLSNPRGAGRKKLEDHKKVRLTLFTKQINWIQKRVNNKEISNMSEYIRDLIKRDRERLNGKQD